MTWHLPITVIDDVTGTEHTCNYIRDESGVSYICNGIRCKKPSCNVWFSAEEVAELRASGELEKAHFDLESERWAVEERPVIETPDRICLRLTKNGCIVYRNHHIHQGEIGPYVITDSGHHHVPDLDAAYALIGKLKRGESG